MSSDNLRPSWNHSGCKGAIVVRAARGCCNKKVTRNIQTIVIIIIIIIIICKYDIASLTARIFFRNCCIAFSHSYSNNSNNNEWNHTVSVHFLCVCRCVLVPCHEAAFGFEFRGKKKKQSCILAPPFELYLNFSECSSVSLEVLLQHHGKFYYFGNMFFFSVKQFSLPAESTFILLFGGFFQVHVDSL